MQEKYLPRVNNLFISESNIRLKIHNKTLTFDTF